jgi:hypothetical protein
MENETLIDDQTIYRLEKTIKKIKTRYPWFIFPENVSLWKYNQGIKKMLNVLIDPDEWNNTNSSTTVRMFNIFNGQYDDYLTHIFWLAAFEDLDFKNPIVQEYNLSKEETRWHTYTSYFKEVNSTLNKWKDKLLASNREVQVFYKNEGSHEKRYVLEIYGCKEKYFNCLKKQVVLWQPGTSMSNNQWDFQYYASCFDTADAICFASNTLLDLTCPDLTYPLIQMGFSYKIVDWEAEGYHDDHLRLLNEMESFRDNIPEMFTKKENPLHDAVQNVFQKMNDTKFQMKALYFKKYKRNSLQYIPIYNDWISTSQKVIPFDDNSTLGSVLYTLKK